MEGQRQQRLQRDRRPDPSTFDAALASAREDYPKAATNAMMNLIDSHDTNRALYETAHRRHRPDPGQRAPQSSPRSSSSPTGAPTVYYGDEAAINAPSLANGTNGPEDDPTTARLPVGGRGGRPPAYGPADAGMIGWYTKLAAFRKAHPSLRGAAGTFTTMLTGDTTASTTDDTMRSRGPVAADDPRPDEQRLVEQQRLGPRAGCLRRAARRAVRRVDDSQRRRHVDAARTGAILYLKPATAASGDDRGSTTAARDRGLVTHRGDQPAATDDRGIA